VDAVLLHDVYGSLDAPYDDDGLGPLSQCERRAILFCPFFELAVPAGQEVRKRFDPKDDFAHNFVGIVLPRSQCPGGPGGRGSLEFDASCLNKAKVVTDRVATKTIVCEALSQDMLGRVDNQ
jgi:hypothetical protein